VVIACAAWPVVTRVSSQPRWLFLRLAVAVTVVLLANATAVTRGARSLVLLGDPQQLTQPTQAPHPAGADASVLEHFLDGHDTIPPDRGVFLNTSWRMHPTIVAPHNTHVSSSESGFPPQPELGPSTGFKANRPPL
jgi:hypothetical protein